MNPQRPSPLGRFIRRRRRELGLSIRALAARIDKSPTFVVLLETEQSPPSTMYELLRSLAAALDVAEDVTFGLVRKVPEESLPKSADEVALFRRVQRMTTNEKARLLARLKKQQEDS